MSNTCPHDLCPHSLVKYLMQPSKAGGAVLNHTACPLSDTHNQSRVALKTTILANKIFAGKSRRYLWSICTTTLFSKT